MLQAASCILVRGTGSYGAGPESYRLQRAVERQRDSGARPCLLGKGYQRRGKEGAMPERPSLEAQIDDDEAWLAANDDDDWDAPAAPPAPAAARSRRPLPSSAGRPPSRPRRARRRRSARSIRRSPWPRSAFMTWGVPVATRWWAVGRPVSGGRARFGATARGGPRPGRRRTGRRVRSRADATLALPGGGKPRRWPD